MFRFALTRLGDPDRAEDAVQEAFAAAFADASSFEGRSTIRTWLIGILRNKVLDQIRRDAVERRARERIQRSGGGGTFLGDDRPGERPSRSPWPAPGTPERAELHALLDRCVRELPPTMREAFCLRVLDGLDSERVCEILGISPTNLWTMVHRAKVRLRRSVSERWFEPASGEDA